MVAKAQPEVVRALVEEINRDIRQANAVGNAAAEELRHLGVTRPIAVHRAAHKICDVASDYGSSEDTPVLLPAETVCAILSISKRQLKSLRTKEDSFPAPEFIVNGNPYWRGDQIREWAEFCIIV